MIERQILLGLITSTPYLQQIHPIWNVRLLESSLARQVSGWCMEYFETYKKAPFKDIETIYFEKLRQGELDSDLAELIEHELFPELNDEFEQDGVNVDYLLEQTFQYLKERHLLLHIESIRDSINSGELLEAEKHASEYRILVKNVEGDLELSNPKVLSNLEKAFDETFQPVVRYTGALGEIWNSQFIRGGFVSLMAPEKRGKTYWLLDIAFRAAKQGSRVAFFQAGDMTENQQLRRAATYLSMKPTKEKYAGTIYSPVLDCVYNQLDLCDAPERECSFGAFSDETSWDEKNIRKEMSREKLMEAFENCGDEYIPCRCCDDIRKKPWGIPWLIKERVKKLTLKEAKKHFETFFINKKRSFKLSTHSNGTLSVPLIETQLDVWQRQDGFIPDLIVIDYADLLIDNTKEFRHQQNNIWKALRGLSQKRHCLVVTATQADAKSYDQNRLKLSNFSEDKRKYAHVTAMYGLNQDKEGREKKIGIMRINELVVREDEFDTNREVYVLYNLNIGRPFISSYF